MIHVDDNVLFSMTRIYRRQMPATLSTCVPSKSIGKRQNWRSFGRETGAGGQAQAEACSNQQELKSPDTFTHIEIIFRFISQCSACGKY